jgi:hypothetical protein
VVHTAAAPPSAGSTILPTIGWHQNSRNALVNNVPDRRGTSVFELRKIYRR